MTTTSAKVENGRFGRSIVMRLRPNLDLVEGVEAACLEHGVAAAMVKAGIGSLIDAAVSTGGDDGAGGRVRHIRGPAVEVLSLAGEVRMTDEGRLRAELWGTVSDPEGRVHGGRLVRGANPVCITMEIVLQEWLPEDRLSA